MRRALHIAFIVLVGYLIVNRAIIHSHAGEPGSISCARGAEIVKSEALRKGFSEAGAQSQSEAFVSHCLVSGHANVGNLIARD
jgi:hypothetical protein